MQGCTGLFGEQTWGRSVISKPNHPLFDDISNWTVTDIPTTGAREKFWVIDEQGTHWLFKFTRENTGEHWAEYLASKLLEVLGLPAPEVKMASYQGSVGSLVKKFVNTGPEQFFEGVDLLEVGGHSSAARHLDAYTLNRIRHMLTPMGLASEFLAIPLFDALVGHVDRHPGNWGVIQTVETGAYRLAPVYDNSACLGAEVQEERIELLLKDPNAYQAFVFGRPRTLIRIVAGNKGAKHVEIAAYIAENHPERFESISEKLELLNSLTIRGILAPLGQILSESRIRFLTKLLEDRRDGLLRLKHR
ncbi:MAG TPA: HipA domain-containing protein [Symbiobacteriaceae bacterium]